MRMINQGSDGHSYLDALFLTMLGDFTVENPGQSSSGSVVSEMEALGVEKVSSLQAAFLNFERRVVVRSEHRRPLGRSAIPAAQTFLT